MDFSAMHPDVWASTRADRWHYYSQLRIAYEEGREEVKHRRGNPDNAKKNMDALLKAHSG